MDHIHMTSLVPQSYHRAGQSMFIAQCTQARSAQHEEFTVDCWLKAEPTRRQHPQKVSACKNQDIPSHSTHPAYNPVSTHADLLRRFSPWTAVAEEFPIRPLRTYFHRSPSLI